jgi:hypothetical protein
MRGFSRCSTVVIARFHALFPFDGRTDPQGGDLRAPESSPAALQPRGIMATAEVSPQHRSIAFPRPIHLPFDHNSFTYGSGIVGTITNTID